MAIIEVKHLHKVFGDLEVLKDISFNVEEGEVICLIGPSGSGKSTLLRCLNKLEEKQDGDIVILGENISEIKKINQFRENIGMVFQHFNLFPNYTVLQNMTLAPTMLKKMSKAEAVKKAEQLLDLSLIHISQGNTTSGLGVDKNEVEDTLYELLVGQSDVEKTIVKDIKPFASFHYFIFIIRYSIIPQYRASATFS